MECNSTRIFLIPPVKRISKITRKGSANVEYYDMIYSIVVKINLQRYRQASVCEQYK